MPIRVAFGNCEKGLKSFCKWETDDQKTCNINADECSPTHGQTESRKRAHTFTTSGFLEKARLTAQLHM